MRGTALANCPKPEVRPLTQREMRIYLHLVHETMDAADLLAAQLRAIEIIANNPPIGDAHG